MFEFVPKGAKAVIFNVRAVKFEYLDTSGLGTGPSPLNIPEHSPSLAASPARARAYDTTALLTSQTLVKFTTVENAKFSLTAGAHTKTAAVRGWKHCVQRE